MSDAVLTLLKWCLLALLYLFFLRVLQASWSGAAGPVVRRNEPGSERRAARRNRKASRLAIVEPPSVAGGSYSLSRELSIGRAAGCQVTLDDTYISQLHAKVSRNDDGDVVVEDLGSTNGTYLNRQRVTAPVMAQRGDRLQVGSVVMEFQ